MPFPNYRLLRRPVILLILSLTAVIGLAVTLWCLPSRPEVTLTTMARLAPGMTEMEVAELIGPPTADLTTCPPAGIALMTTAGRLLEYAGDQATAQVEFDTAGRLVRCYPKVRIITGLERLRLRLNWW